jgi:hypothetical protein
MGEGKAKVIALLAMWMGTGITPIPNSLWASVKTPSASLHPHFPFLPPPAFALPRLPLMLLPLCRAPVIRLIVIYLCVAAPQPTNGPVPANQVERSQFSGNPSRNDD